MKNITTRLLQIVCILLQMIAVLSDTCPAQGVSKLDSLNVVLRTQKEDSSKVNTLNALSRQLWQTSSYAESIQYADMAIELAETIRFKKGMADAYNNLGIILTYQGNYSEALKKLFTGLSLHQEIGNKNGIAISYNAISGIYNRQSNYPEALKYLFSFLNISEELGDKKGVANAYNNIGLIYSVQGNSTEALKYHLASLKIKEEMGDKRGISNSLGNMGVVYSKQGIYPEALKYHFASLKIKEEMGDMQGAANSYNNIGLIYMNQNNFPEALKNCFVSLKMNEQIGSKSGIAYAYNSIGLIYEKERNHEEALKNHMASLKIREELDEKKGIACSYINMGESYIGLNRYAEAKRVLNDGLALSKKIGSMEDIEKCYKELTRLDSATGNWEEAYYNHKLFILYRDSLTNEENRNKIVQAQMQFDFSKKEDSLTFKNILTNEKLKQQYLLSQQQQQALLMKDKEYSLIMSEKKLQELKLEKNQSIYAIQKAEVDKKQGQLVILNKENALQTLQLEKQKLLKNYLFLVIALFSILSFFIYKQYSTKQKLKLQTLRNKIASDLHDDVGSTLSSISIFSQLVQQQSKEVIPMLETIGESSRKMLDAMADIVWTINPENDQFEKIILRMRGFAFDMLGAKKIDFEFIVDEEVAKMKLLMDMRKNLYLIFKEAINNMVKYSGADKAFFSIKGEKNILNLIIRDNGKGFDMNQVTEGNGLKNMKKRAEEIGAKVLIDSFPGKGTTVQLNLYV